MKLFFDIISYVINLVVIFQWGKDLRKKYLLDKHVNSVFGSKTFNIYLPIRVFENDRVGYSNEDFHAATNLSEFLQNKGFNIKYVPIKPSKFTDFVQNSIIICGPKSSSTIKNLLSQDPYYGIVFEMESWKIEDKKNNINISSPLDLGGDRDLAYLSILRSNGQTIILIAGIHAIGSYGAASFITNLKNLEKLNKCSKVNNLSVIISTKFGQDSFLYESDIFLQIRDW